MDSADVDSYADACTDWHSNRHTNTYAYPHRHANADGYADTRLNPDANCILDSSATLIYANSDSDRITHAIEYTDRNGFTYCDDCPAHRHADTYSHAH